MTKFKKKNPKNQKLSKNSQKNLKIKNGVIFVTFFPNPIQSQKYTKNHDHTTFLKKNY